MSNIMEENRRNYSIYLVDSPKELFQEIHTRKRGWLPTPSPKRKIKSHGITCTYCLIENVSFFIVDSSWNEFQEDSGYMRFIECRPMKYEKVIIPDEIMYKERAFIKAIPVFTNTKVGGTYLGFKNPIPVIDIIHNVYEYLAK